MFWPSFNSALLDIPDERKKAIFNTYYALAVSAVTAISMSALIHPKGKINMVRRGLSPGRHLGSLGLTRIFMPPPPASAPWIGTEHMGQWSLVCSIMEYQPRQCWLVKMGLEHRRLSNDQRLSWGMIKLIHVDIKHTLLVIKGSPHE